MEAVIPDRQLFFFLRSQLRQYRGRSNHFMSMTQVQKIFFVKPSFCPSLHRLLVWQAFGLQPEAEALDDDQLDARQTASGS
jgi:hypothetical protein